MQVAAAAAGRCAAASVSAIARKVV